MKIAVCDNITADCRDGTKLLVRLHEIDDPEIRHDKKPDQSYGEEAKVTLMGMVLGRKNLDDMNEKDQYKLRLEVVGMR